MTDPKRHPHPSVQEFTAYLAHDLEGDARRRLEDHLARCSDCRREIVDARQVLEDERGTRLRSRRWALAMPLAAAAAVALLLLTGVPPDGVLGGPPSVPVHREAPGAAVEAPTPIAPIGTMDTVVRFTWTRTLGADRYRLTLFDSEGSVTWTATTADSTLAFPDSVELGERQIYLWRVEARVGWDVWEPSPLAEFRLTGGGTP